MRRASLLFLLFALAAATLLRADEEAKEASKDPKAVALREILVGAPFSERKRRNKLKRFAEIKGWHKKDREKLLAEGREKAMGAARRAAKDAMEAAFAKAGMDGALVEQSSKQADHLREDWESMRRGTDAATERLKTDREAQARWTHQRGFTRAGTDAAAAAFIFSDERFVAIPPETLRFLAALGFDEEEAGILIYGLDLMEQIAHRMEAAAQADKERRPGTP